MNERRFLIRLLIVIEDRWKMTAHTTLQACPAGWKLFITFAHYAENH
jgi:hypothetical protein